MQTAYITGNTINAYYVCKRKLWLFMRQIMPNRNYELLELGRLISNETYLREKKEISLEGMKIDIVKKEHSSIVIGEIKKSSSCLKAAKMQLVFYLYQLKKEGINLKGEILIPKEREKIPIELTDELEDELNRAISDIEEISSKEIPPSKEKIKFCTHCAYREFCWA